MRQGPKLCFESKTNSGWPLGRVAQRNVPGGLHADHVAEDRRTHRYVVVLPILGHWPGSWRQTAFASCLYYTVQILICLWIQL